MNISDAADINRFLLCKYSCDPELLDALKKKLTGDLGENKKNDLQWNLMGHIHYIEEDYAAAARCFRNCIRINKKKEHYLIMLAFAMRHMGEYSTSERIHLNLLKGRNPGFIIESEESGYGEREARLESVGSEEKTPHAGE